MQLKVNKTLKTFISAFFESTVFLCKFYEKVKPKILLNKLRYYDLSVLPVAFFFSAEWLEREKSETEKTHQRLDPLIVSDFE